MQRRKGGGLLPDVLARKWAFNALTSNFFKFETKKIYKIGLSRTGV
jgi:hypothetical protein